MQSGCVHMVSDVFVCGYSGVIVCGSRLGRECHRGGSRRQIRDPQRTYASSPKQMHRWHLTPCNSEPFRNKMCVALRDLLCTHVALLRHSWNACLVVHRCSTQRCFVHCLAVACGAQGSDGAPRQPSARALPLSHVTRCVGLSPLFCAVVQHVAGAGVGGRVGRINSAYRLSVMPSPA